MFFKNRNQRNIRKIEIDGCVVKDDNLRCDWLIVDSNDTEHFVELKSKHRIFHGIDQIRNTINLLCSDKRDSARRSFLIHNRNPRYSGKIQNEKVKFENEFNSQLIVEKTPYTYDL